MSTASSVNMRSILGVLMVLAVSANEAENITRFAGESVLLVCDCPGRDPNADFYWQMESDITEVKVITRTDTDVRYKGRANIFVNETGNCSLFLSNLNVNDTGIYKCIHPEGVYNRVSKNLTVIARPNPEGLSASCIRFFKIIPIVLLVGFCLDKRSGGSQL
ncbi:uncharacterized protein si:dkey-192g7.3 [Platichthys flesus]|uniref:uncharacterized protein si:dkey-192g7.3 n=1 Tax=Platichthys flesus TaxID=8260 RepID=UPI002DB6CB31|nr:uncharacterized protein si:dkey-192g7.3 [Platichthys flesus]